MALFFFTPLPESYIIEIGMRPLRTHPDCMFLLSQRQTFLSEVGNLEIAGINCLLLVNGDIGVDVL